VAVISASGLRNTDRGLFRRFGDCSDPYVVVSAGKQKLWTATVNNDLNPVWNSQWFSFTLGQNDKSLSLEVFDSDLLTSDELLGKAQVDVASLRAGEWLDRKESLGAGNGDIELRLRLERQQASRVDRADRMRTELGQKLEEERRAAVAGAEKGAGDILTVTVLGATGLRNTDRGLFRRSGDASDPYAVVSVGSQKLRTTTIDNCLDPVWDSDKFSFTLSDDRSLRVQVFDADLLTSDELLGEALVDVKTLAVGEWVLVKSSLGPGNGEIELKVRLEKQAKQRLDKAQKVQEQLVAEQAEQLKLAKAKAAQGAGDVLTVAVISATGLRNTDRGLFRRFGDCSDPYVLVSAGKQKLWTPTINNNLDPVWDAQWFTLTLGKADTTLNLEVFDSDFLTSDELLGKVQVDVASLRAGEWLDRKESLGAGNGEIEFRLRLEKQPAARVSKADEVRMEMERKLEEERAAARASVEKGAGKVVSVKVLAAHSLSNTESSFTQLFGDKSDPYVNVSVGSAKLHTRVVWNDLDPKWPGEPFNFSVDGTEQPLRLEVWDFDPLDPDDLLGKVELNLTDLKVGEWIPFRRPLADQPTGGKGELSFEVRVEPQERARMDKVSQAGVELETKQALEREEEAKEGEKRDKEKREREKEEKAKQEEEK